MLNISSKTKSHILVLIFGPHVPLWLPSIVTSHENINFGGTLFRELKKILAHFGGHLNLRKWKIIV